MKKNIPTFLYDKLIKDYSEEITEKIVKGYSFIRPVTLRVNTSKTTIDEIKKEFDKLNVSFEDVSWYKDSLIINDIREDFIRNLDIYNNGHIYMQSLSSMLPPLIVNPKEGQSILDMAASPGGKTTQMANLSDNKSLIMACEKNKIRAERLKYNIQKQGSKKVSVVVKDARNLDEYFTFDKILLDAPCSGSGTLNINDNFNDNFTEDFIKNNILNPNGFMANISNEYYLYKDKIDNYFFKEAEFKVLSKNDKEMIFEVQNINYEASCLGEGQIMPSFTCSDTKKSEKSEFKIVKDGSKWKIATMTVKTA